MNRRSSNLVRGRRGNIGWEIFDFCYIDSDSKISQTVMCGIVLARLPVRFPKMQIRPETIADKLSAMTGAHDIEFESDDFNKRYYVRSEDRRFAHELIHPKMMQYLLAAPAMHWELGGSVLLIARMNRFHVGELPCVMELIEGFVRLIPPFVRQDRGTV